MDDIEAITEICREYSPDHKVLLTVYGEDRDTEYDSFYEFESSVKDKRLSGLQVDSRNGPFWVSIDKSSAYTHFRSYTTSKDAAGALLIRQVF